MKHYRMALDQGTTSSRCIIFNEKGADLRDGRNARNHQVHCDQQHTGNGHQTQSQENAMDDPFKSFVIFHFIHHAK